MSTTDLPLGSGGAGPSRPPPINTQMTQEPSSLSAASDSAAAATRSARPRVEKEVSLRATDKTPIWSTHYLDPSLRSTLTDVSAQLTNAASVALSGFANGSNPKYNAQMNDLAKVAKEWTVPPDARFVTDQGGIDVSLGVVDSSVEGWGRDKGRKKARVECVSRYGGIKVEVVSFKQLM